VTEQPVEIALHQQSRELEMALAEGHDSGL
jgi:hypothetical protein